MEFNPLFSTRETYRNDDRTKCLEDDLLAVEAALPNKAPLNHTHDGYASSDHTHSGYASTSHTHSYNDLTEKPTIPSVPSSLPANGGNADTVDNKHASDFATSAHNHDSTYVSKDLQFTDDNGSFKIAYTRDDGKNILTEMQGYDIGFYTVYSQSGTSGNPKTTEAWRMIFHKTGATNGWVQAYGSIGSVYTNYLDSSNWRGWKCIWDNSPEPLWSGAMYMTSTNSTPQTVTPSKKLSECRNGWLLLWSDYDAGSGANDADFVTTMIPKRNPSGGTWGGKSFLCDIPRYVGSDPDDTSTEKRIIKPIYVHDNCIKGSYQNASGDRNDVVLRAVYEF